MDGIDDRGRRDARTVEITVALLLGTLVAVLPAVAMWVAAMADRGGGDWSTAERAVHLVALLAGAAVAVWWLVRSERRRPE